MKAKTTLREALADDRLLGKALPGPSWFLWRTLLIAAMGEPLVDDEELQAFQSVTGRQTPPSERVEELIAVIGRRGGKSRAIAVLAVYLATLVDYSSVLVTGERGVLLTVAPDIRQAQIVKGYIRGILQDSPVLAPLLEIETRWEIRLTNGIDIETKAANFRTLRGVTAIGAIADETCFWYSEETSANPDTAILDALRPCLATTKGLLAIISTPYARRGATWEAYHRHYGAGGDPGILVAHGASRTFNPSLPQSVIDRAYERDPEAAKAEYGGEWRSDITGFVDRAAVQACVDVGVHERPYASNIRYLAHVDPSGGGSDSMTLAVSHRAGDRAVLDLVREVKPPFSPESVVQDFAGELARYRIKQVVGDRYAGEWPRDAFRRHRIEYKVCDRTASQLFVEMLPLVNAGTARLLDSKRLVDQLVSLERRTSFGTGRDTIGHPPGQHDDVAVAAAGALVAAAAPETRCWIGSFDGGRIIWHDQKPRTEIKIVQVPETSVPAITNRGWPR